jgi:hypothetical protein
MANPEQGEERGASCPESAKAQQQKISLLGMLTSFDQKCQLECVLRTLTDWPQGACWVLSGPERLLEGGTALTALNRWMF